MRLILRTHFDAAHYLPRYNGPCSRVHGHRWDVEVEVEGTPDPYSGMVVDFKDLKAMVNGQLPDHRLINEYIPECDPPTAEMLAGYLFAKIKTVIPGLRALTVWESPDAGAKVTD